jgi:hypothetical protein
MVTFTGAGCFCYDPDMGIGGGGGPGYAPLATTTNLGWPANYQFLPETAGGGKNNIAVYFLAPMPFGQINITVGFEVGVYDGDAVTPEYWNGGWTPLVVNDTTDIAASNGKQPFRQNGIITFTPPSDWSVVTINGNTGYAIRYRVSDQIQLTGTSWSSGYPTYGRVYPTVGYVKDGISYGPTGADYMGTYEGPGLGVAPANGAYSFLEAVRAVAEVAVKQFKKVRMTSGPQDTYDIEQVPMCEVEFGDIDEADVSSDAGIEQTVNGTVRVIVGSEGGDERKAIETALGYINRVKNAVGANTTFVAYLGRMGRVTATEAEDPFEGFEFPITGKILSTATGR